MFNDSFESLKSLSQWISKVHWENKLIITLIILIILVIARILFKKIFLKRIENIRYRYKYSKIFNYLLYFIAFVFVMRTWYSGINSLMTALGILSAGFAFIFKDLLICFIGWIFIIVRKPFEIGDRIEINNVIGDVIDIRGFMFSLMEVGNWVDADQSTGRVVHIPNNFVFLYSLYNYHQGLHYIWNEIPVVITFESNWKKAKTQLGAIASAKSEKLDSKIKERIKKTASRFYINYSILDPKVYTKVDPNGVRLTIRYLCDPRKRRSTEEELWEY